MSWALAKRLLFIIIMALITRLWIWLKSPVINPDGALYIWQAKNFLLYGFEGLVYSSYPLMSVYPIFIAFFSLVFSDIEFSAKLLSIFMGTLTTIPIFFIAYETGNIATATIISLLFVTLPVTAGSNGLIIRDIPCWFFISLGMYFTIKYINSRQNLVYTCISSLSYLISFLFRPETIIFNLITFIFIFFIYKEKLLKHVFYYTLPILISLPIVASLAISHNTNIFQLFSITRIFGAISSLLDSYPTMYKELKTLSQIAPIGVVKRLLAEVPNFLWLLIPAILIKQFIRTLVYVPLIFVVVGVSTCLKNRSPVINYSLILSICVFTVIGCNYMLTGIADGRFFIQALIAMIPVLGIGIISSIDLLKKAKFEPKKGYILLGFGMVFISIISIIKYSEADKLVFKEIGDFIQQNSTYEDPKILAFSTETITVSYFYATKGTKPQASFKGEDGRLFTNICDYNSFLSYIRKFKINYIIWDEKHWPQNCFDFVSKVTNDRFRLLGIWEHKTTGKILLAEVPANLTRNEEEF